MRIRSALVVVGLGGLLVTASSPAQERPAPAFPTQAEAITVDVVVLDKDGHPVSDLTREDFTVLDDGRPQVVVGFEARALTRAQGAESTERADGLTATNEGSPQGRRVFAFILDDLGTEPLHMTDGVKAVTSWLEHSADPRDEVTLLTTSGEGWWSDSVGRGRDDLIAVLANVRGKKASQDAVDSMSEWEAYRIDAFEGGGVNPDVPDAQGVAALTVAPPNQQCIRPHGSSANDLMGRVVDRWMATKACQCESITTETILSSRQSCRAQVAGTARALHRATLQRAQAMLGAIERLSRGLAGSSGRKSILVLSDGLVRDTQLERFDAAVDATQKGNAAVSFIDLRGLAGSAAYHADQTTTPKEGDLAAVDLEQSLLETAGTEYVAAATGGSTVRDTNDLLGGLTRVADEAAAYYLLGYQPDKPRDGKHHKLEVKVSRPGVTVRARRGYVASPAPQAVAADRSADPAPQAGKGPKRALDPALMAGAFDDAIPIRIAPYVLEPDGSGLARVRVAVEVDTSKISLDGAAGTGHATLDLTLLGASRGKGKLVPLDERLRFDVGEKSAGGWLTLSRDLHLPEGVAMVRVLVRDVATGRAGSVAQRFEVPSLNAPYLTTPVLTDRAQTLAHGFPQLLPVAHRHFRSASLLYCQYGVEGLGDSQGRVTLRVMGGHILQLAGGPVVRLAPPTMIAMGVEGELVRTFTLPMEGLAAGDYRLVIDVVDEATGRGLSAALGFTLDGPPVPAGE